MDRIIFHIDVNNAFLSWSAIDLLNKGYKYDIRNSYAVIGGDPEARKGIVLAKSTPAKKMGIKTAETLYSAKRKCPALRIYPSNYPFYAEMSSKLFLLLSKYTPDIEIASIDECYLDYGKIKRLYGEENAFAIKIQKEIYDTLGFTVNIGIANNKLCAKMASDFSKPNKIHTLYDNEIKDKMWGLPVEELFGCGKKTALKLYELNIRTIGELANTKVEKISPYFKNMAYDLILKANGIDNSEIVIYEEPKGIGNEITLERDVTNKEEIIKILFGLSDKVARRVRNQNKYATTIVVVLKDNYFKRISHQKKLKNATNNPEEIFELAKIILNEMWKESPIRLIGIRLDNLVTDSYHQISLFENIKNKDESSKLDKVLDDLQNKFGNKIIKKASLINEQKFD